MPLGILCGTYAAFARLNEPFIEFFRYLPAPAFGALAVAILGIYDGPKIAIIVIGTFFQQVLIIANTTRKLDVALVEAALTLGTKKARKLLSRVVMPGILPDLYRDQRILLGWAWTYLIVAELIGTSSGITWFITQQARYQHFDNVYAAIMMIGIIGLGTDMLLALAGRRLFPWDRSLVKSEHEACTMNQLMMPPLPSYLDQSPEVRARFERLKAREVILDVRASRQDRSARASRTTVALNDINFTTHRREFLCVVGPSGCGKSTLVRILAGLEEQTLGRGAARRQAGDAARAATAAWCSRATRCFPG